MRPDPCPLDAFHPAVAAWFRGAFAAPTAAQARAWPAIRAGGHVLVAAPTGSGKTLTAFLAALDALVREGVANGGALPDETRVVYVSPLKALSNDIHVNLDAPLEGIRAELEKLGLPGVAIRTAVRTGDTPQAERAWMRKTPPHVLVTTPESLYILLGSASGREMLKGTRSVIVDEIHAVAGSKRGAHLALSLERLEALCQRRLQRIGLSATQKPIEEVADFLVGATSPSPLWGEGRGEGPTSPQPSSKQAPGKASASTHSSSDPPGHLLPGGEKGKSHCTIIDTGHIRQRDLALEVPPVPLEAVMSNDAWVLVYDRLAQLVQAHRTTLVFVNTRRLAERAARHLSERLGKETVAAHHGSLAKEQRLDAEQRLKRGELSVLVATASLELGIDIGDVDLVCQLGSPRSIAAFLQRAGRSGHHVGGTPKARLFPTTRDDLVECAALLDAVRRDELDALVQPPQPLDVLAQQIVAEVACREWDEDALYALVRGAHPYRALARADFDAVVRMLAEGFTTRRGARAAYVHRDAVHHRLRARRGARLTALTSGGAIPDTADYLVVLEPQATVVGTVHEDFAVESLAGDIFQLGNTSYRIQRVEPGRLRVEDAHGVPPSIPFWLGEAPGRSDELSFAVSRLREEMDALLEPLSHRESTVLSAPKEGRGEGSVFAPPSDTTEPSPPAPPPEGEGSKASAWLRDELGLGEAAARQLVEYLAGAKAALGTLPTQSTLVFERFFDESGGTQLVIHAPFGSRINRAWGLALRKRFCRQFNFELQAAATEDAIVLSLSTSHSFPLEEVARYLHSGTAEHVLVQALLDAPLFPARWRWNAVTALALPRFAGGRKVPPQLQRMKSEDLLAAVFPDQVACLENIVGERQIPDHPLVAQTLHDCLREAMDTDGLLRLLRGLESGAIRLVARDLPAPSPLAGAVLNAAPYAFLDDAPLEERRTRAVRQDVPAGAGDMGRLDPDAIAAVRAEAWPEVRNADEMHEALDALGGITAAEAATNEGWEDKLHALARDQRVTCLSLSPPQASAPSPLRGEGWGEGTSSPRSSSKLAFGNAPAGTRSSSALPGTSSPRGRRNDGVWVCAEKLPLWRAVHPEAALHPAIAAPAEYAAQAWTREDALRELVRGRLLGLGPVTADALAAPLGVPPAEAETALLRLQAEGYVIQGTFDPAVAGTQWCERHLLARIHRYTLGRLRREIEPVSRRELMRFLLDWQHASPATRLRGPDALPAVLAQLEGYEAAAGAWETEILPTRIADYSASWLDAQCRAGRIGWSRLRAGGGGGPVRATPIVLLPRRQMAVWAAIAGRDDAQDELLSSRAQAVADALREQGALFFDELLAATRLLRTELEDALGELVAAGRASADSFAGLRALLLPAAKREAPRHRRLRRHQFGGIEDAGRWSLVRRLLLPSGARGERPWTAAALGSEEKVAAERPNEGRALAGKAGEASTQDSPLASIPFDRLRAGLSPQGRGGERGASRPGESIETEHVARTLLARYGVVFWQLLEREAPWLPPWRELLRVYRRLEARGEIRGGRFVEGLVGEQFALPEAIAPLRAIRQRGAQDELVCIGGCDPLNLVGGVLAGDKVPAVPGSRVLYRDGVPVAARVAGKFVALAELPPELAQAARRLLLHPAARSVDDALPSSRAG
ncbi:DEAD/DEAH box helicase [Fulvimonas sp. R45]|uniref:DEAD/DEAH box helicase n=1 Tax=Fulvimonas sp. R45 TaxID=3045937 RepID=UPI00265DCBF1|nr:DEAD/DEAH box helicase [Fulvimonas sp. R45]MDO1529627.1 DEAD/DEAH box helicase [Fulvimonas sp. R45]